MQTNYHLQIGGWVLRPDSLTLHYYGNGSSECDVELASCTTSRGMLRTILQFAANGQFARKAVGDLVTILSTPPVKAILKQTAREKRAAG